MLPYLRSRILTMLAQKNINSTTFDSHINHEYYVWDQDALNRVFSTEYPLRHLSDTVLKDLFYLNFKMKYYFRI